MAPSGIKTLAPNLFALPGLRRSVTQVLLQSNAIESLQPTIFEPFAAADSVSTLVQPQGGSLYKASHAVALTHTLPLVTRPAEAHTIDSASCMLWQNVEVLRLDHNQLGTLPAGILSPFHETLRVLVLSNNPITLFDPYIFLPLVCTLLSAMYPRSTHTTAPTPALG